MLAPYVQFYLSRESWPRPNILHTRQDDIFAGHHSLYVKTTGFQLLLQLCYATLPCFLSCVDWSLSGVACSLSAVSFSCVILTSYVSCTVLRALPAVTKVDGGPRVSSICTTGG